MTRILRPWNVAWLALLGFLTISWETGPITFTARSLQPSDPQDRLTLEQDRLYFSLPRFGGGRLSSEAFSGKILIAWIWATWCQPCRDEGVWLPEVWQRFAGAGVELAGIGLDDDASEQAEHIQAAGWRFPLVTAAQDVVTAGHQIRHLPTLFILSADGRIYRKYEGLISRAVVEKDLEALTGLRPAASPATEDAAHADH